VGVAVAGDTVFTGSLLGTVSAVDARSGTAFWSTDLGEAAFRPAVSDSLVLYGTRGYFGTGPREGPLGAGHLVALRRADGSEAWRFPLPDSAGFSLSGGAVSAGVVVGDRVIVGGVSARVYALSLADGGLIWERANGRSPPVASYRLEAAAVEDVVVLPRDDNRFEGRDVGTGELLWLLDRPTAVTPARVMGGLFYLIDGPITVLDPSGTVRWQFGGLSPTGAGLSYYRGSVASDGAIYTLCASHVVAGGGVEICAIRPPVP
jgi:outer membrane protein assembly factor BamB